MYPDLQFFFLSEFCHHYSSCKIFLSAVDFCSVDVPSSTVPLFVFVFCSSALIFFFIFGGKGSLPQNTELSEAEEFLIFVVLCSFVFFVCFLKLFQSAFFFLFFFILLFESLSRFPVDFLLNNW